MGLHESARIDAKLEKRIKNANGVAQWDGTIGYEIHDRFFVAKTEFIVIHYYGYFVHVDFEDYECENEKCHDLYACLYGVEKKAKTFLTPEEATLWAMNRMRRPADEYWAVNSPSCARPTPDELKTHPAKVPSSQEEEEHDFENATFRVVHLPPDYQRAEQSRALEQKTQAS